MTGFGSIVTSRIECLPASPRSMDDRVTLTSYDANAFRFAPFRGLSSDKGSIGSSTAELQRKKASFTETGVTFRVRAARLAVVHLMSVHSLEAIAFLALRVILARCTLSNPGNTFVGILRAICCKPAYYFFGDDCGACSSPWTDLQRKNWP